MDSEVSSKNQKFKNEIRRRQRQNILKRDRQQRYIQQMKEPSKVNYSQPQFKQRISENLTKSCVKELYKTINRTNSFMQNLPNELFVPLLRLIISSESLETSQGVLLLNLFVQSCGDKNKNIQDKIQLFKNIIQISGIENVIFQLLQKSMQEDRQTSAKIYLFLIKNLALYRMEFIRNKQILEQYLFPIISKYVSETSLIIFLTFVSEIHPLSLPIIKMLINEAQKTQHKIVKIGICSIFHYYVSNQPNPETFQEIFEPFVTCMEHIYINNKQAKLNSSQLEMCLLNIIQIIQRFPQNYEIQLLQKIGKVKIQQIAIVSLQVSQDRVKLIILELEQQIIEKTVPILKQNFFKYFSQEVIQYIIKGIHSSNHDITFKCLQMLNTLFEHCPPQILNKYERQNNLCEILQNLTFSKNEYVSNKAEQVRNLFPFDQNKQYN